MDRCKFYVIDPIHGAIDIPPFIAQIFNEKAIRRMMFIRQLGLKAYIDFPGAIHTRYSHALGVMHLAQKLTDLLKESGNEDIRSILEGSKNAIISAGFLHDLGHGPFSHVGDYVLEKVANKTHVEMTEEIIRDKFEEYFIKSTINMDSVINIIKGKFDYPFVHQIIDSQIDVDRLDYLLRDAYFVGLKYSFDLDKFVREIKIIGEDYNPEECELGLKNTPEAIVTTEIFFIIRRSMYQLVYNIKDSRIAEKMLEKALILECEKGNSELKEYFTNIEKFVNLNDEFLLEYLEKNGNSFSKNIVEDIRRTRLYEEIKSYDLSELTGIIKEDMYPNDKTAHTLSEKLCEKLTLDPFKIIVDIIRIDKPKDVHLEPKEEGEELKSIGDVSKIIHAIDDVIMFKIYVDPTVKKDKNLNTEYVDKAFKDVLGDVE
ncbi:MAG: HD domain-containing protein [Nitrososphaerales archaeon]